MEDGCANLDKQIENVRLVRGAGRRRDQPLPDRHGARARADPRRSLAAGAVGAHLPTCGARAVRAGRTWRAPSRGSRSAEAFRFLYDLDWSDQAKDRDDRDEDLRRRRCGLSARGRAADREVHRPGLRQPADLHGQDAPVDLARPGARAGPPASASPSATCAPRSAPASCIRCSARCARCRGCRPSPTRGRSTWTTRAMSWASSDVAGLLRGGGARTAART